MSTNDSSDGTRHPGHLRRAIVLLSGGLDSATALAIACSEGFECYALSFDYGQRHRAELTAAGRVAKSLPVHDHIVIPIDLRRFGGSALTAPIDVPKDFAARETTAADTTESSAIPITYVPARNTVFLSLALAWAEVLQAEHLFIGVNAVDYSGYPDCRPEFIAQFERLANLATKAGVEGTSRFQIHTPLISLTKAEIIQRGTELGVDYRLTHSCYDPDPPGTPCGACDSCELRKRGFAAAGIPDPALFRT